MYIGIYSAVVLIMSQIDKASFYLHSATDSFVANGVQNEFSLSWAAEYKKSDIVVTINGIPILATDTQLIHLQKNILHLLKFQDTLRCIRS